MKEVAGREFGTTTLSSPDFSEIFLAWFWFDTYFKYLGDEAVVSAVIGTDRNVSSDVPNALITLPEQRWLVLTLFQIFYAKNTNFKSEYFEKI